MSAVSTEKANARQAKPPTEAMPQRIILAERVAEIT